MARRSLQLFVILALMCLAAAAANAQGESTHYPQLINYQGMLTDSTGYPITATVSITFSIYSDEADITPRWSETQNSVEVVNGVFDIELGSVVPIPTNMFKDKERWLGVKVEADAEMTPRKRLTSTPYAYHSAYVGIVYTVPATPRDSNHVEIKIPHHIPFQISMSQLGGPSVNSAWITAGENSEWLSYAGIDGAGNVVSDYVSLYSQDTILTVRAGLILRPKGDGSYKLVLDSENYDLESKAVIFTPNESIIW